MTPLTPEAGDDRILFQNGKVVSIPRSNVTDADCMLRNHISNRNFNTIPVGTEFGVTEVSSDLMVEMVTLDLRRKYFLICSRGETDERNTFTVEKIQSVLGDALIIQRNK